MNRMNTVKNITLLWTMSKGGMDPVHLSKDVFFVPFMLGKLLGGQVDIVHYLPEGAAPLPETHQGVRLIPLKGEYSYSLFKKYMEQHAKQIDVLMMFHFSRQNIYIAKRFKKLNPSGFVYIKLDINIVGAAKQRGIKPLLKKVMCARLLKHVDYYSCETKAAFANLRKNGLSGYSIQNRVHYIPNGLSEDILAYPKRTYSKKENIMLTVGRLGTYPKHTELLLDALAETDLKDWKVLLIGPATEEIRAYYEQKCTTNGAMREQVEFVGDIADRETLFAYYDKAKVFLFTSRYESFGIVLGEAAVFDNYIVSTDVGAASDLTDGWKYGTKITDKDDLIKTLRSIVSQTKDVRIDDSTHAAFLENYTWENALTELVEKIKMHVSHDRIGHES